MECEKLDEESFNIVRDADDIDNLRADYSDPIEDCLSGKKTILEICKEYPSYTAVSVVSEMAELRKKKAQMRLSKPARKRK